MILFLSEKERGANRSPQSVHPETYTMPPNVHVLFQESHRSMSQELGFSPQIQTTRPDDLLCNVADSKYHDPSLWASRLPRIVNELDDRTATSEDRDQYKILYPESLGPI